MNVVAHNRAADENKYEYKTSINRFSMLTRAEYQRKLGVKATRKANTTVEAQTRFLQRHGVALKNNVPAQVNWIPKMTAAKNQFDCGGCWSFAAVRDYFILLIFLFEKCVFINDLYEILI